MMLKCTGEILSWINSNYTFFLEWKGMMFLRNVFLKKCDLKKKNHEENIPGTVWSQCGPSNLYHRPESVCPSGTVCWYGGYHDPSCLLDPPGSTFDSVHLPRVSLEHTQPTLAGNQWTHSPMAWCTCTNIVGKAIMPNSLTFMMVIVLENILTTDLKNCWTLMLWFCSFSLKITSKGVFCDNHYTINIILLKLWSKLHI